MRAKLFSSFLVILALVLQTIAPSAFLLQDVFAASSVVIFGSGFEDSEGGAGFGKWSRQDVKWTQAGVPSHAGSKKAIASGSTEDIPNILGKRLSTEGYENISLSFLYQIADGNHFEKGDNVKVEWTPDGINWYTLKTFIDGDESDIWNDWSADLPIEANDNEQFRIRFVATLNQSSDVFYLDSVNVRGTKIEKTYICHDNGGDHPFDHFNVISVNSNGWNDHGEHQNDFAYSGEVDENGKPTTKGLNWWCGDHIPNEPDPEPAICVPGLELIKNGDFETPSVTHISNWDIFNNGAAGLEWLVAWMSPGSTRYPDPLTGAWIPDVAKLEFHKDAFWSSRTGEQFAELDGDWDGPNGANLPPPGEPASVKISQIIPTVPGKEYQVKFSFSPRPGTDASQNMLGVFWNGIAATSTLSLDGSTNTDTMWKDYMLILVATSSMAEILFADLGTPDSLGTFLDNVSVECLEDCVETSGMISSGIDTLVTNVVTDLGDPDTTSDYQALEVSDVTSIQALGPGVWGALTSDPLAKWIWSEDPVTDWETDKWVTFEKDFTVTGTQTTATLEIATDNSYEVWVNGSLVGSDSGEDNHSSIDTIDVSSSLLTGANKLTIRIKNWATPDLPAINNPGGLLYTLSWSGKDCDDGGNPGEPGKSTIYVEKFLDGEPADNNSDETFGIEIVLSTESATDVLNPDNDYLWTSNLLSNGLVSGDIFEDTSESKVLPHGNACVPGKYRVVGYTYGNTWAEAMNSAATSTTGYHLNGIDKDQYVIIWNETCPTSATISASKIICTDETDLPNWGAGSDSITANTAVDWLETHESCSLTQGWEFEWASDEELNPGDNTLGPVGSPWNLFGPTDTNGVVTASIDLTAPISNISLREVLKANYISFTGENTIDNVSAEMYCADDVLNYDNFELISNLEAGNTYHCVAWNVPTTTPPGDGGGSGGNNPFTLTITTSGDGEGEILGTGISCASALGGTGETGDCTETYATGTLVTLTSTPNSGSNFNIGWSTTLGDPGFCIASSTPCDVTINGDVTLNAHFTLDGTTSNGGETGGDGDGGGNDGGGGSTVTTSSGNGGGGGGGQSGSRGFPPFVLGAASSGGGNGGSGGGPKGQVLGAFTGLPDTGMGLINKNTQLSSLQFASNSGVNSVFGTVLVGMLALFTLNFFSIKVVRLHKR
jgi:hypothetical protein